MRIELEDREVRRSESEIFSVKSVAGPQPTSKLGLGNRQRQQGRPSVRLQQYSADNESDKIATYPSSNRRGIGKPTIAVYQTVSITP